MKKWLIRRVNKALYTCLLLFPALMGTDCTDKKEDVTLPFLDTALSIDQRVDDLVARMTLAEKIGQMVHDAPAIERLHIPRYNWWSEGLHGVARAGLATVFPQAIGLGATWDPALMHAVSTAIADEARAKHHHFARRDKRFIYQGLTLWSPNINIFRDPRWGRGQETYGEDPFLTGTLAVEFIRGLQGDDPHYLKTVATVKHFAVHSGPEPERHTFNATTHERDLREMYLPHFEMTVRLGKPYSVMCAYNRYNGEPCCGSPGLLNDILRKEWGFEGYVVSDCEAITDIYKHHKFVAGPEEAASVAVRAGTDLECGSVYTNLKEAVNRKLIDEEAINTAVKRLFKARFKLGMFDPIENVNYAQTPYSVVDSKEHRALALEAARKSIVLLKNENNLLPLKKDAGTIAVIGPNADQWLMLLGNYNGVPSRAITPLQGIREKVTPHTRVLFAQGSELADGMPMFYTIPADMLSTGENTPGLTAAYYNNITLTGQPLYTAVSPTLDANWSDKAPREDMDDDNFSVRWQGEIKPQHSGTYRLGFISTCNTRLYIDDSLVAKTVYHFRDEYGDPRLRKTTPMRLEAGRKYKVVVEAIETFADAQVQLVWAAPKPDLLRDAIAIARQADVVVLCMGLTARMEGEEMDVQIAGFRGGDRTRIDLPETQQRLIRNMHALGKPVVLVLLNGSALAVNWENDHLPAIVEAWYPGQAAGQAIADVLFGDYNPAGRLPVTFYRSADDLPRFDDYTISNQTYRYFQGKPLYSFGHGLSYSSFVYADLQATRKTGTDSLALSARLQNTGKFDGDEVVQVYASSPQVAGTIRHPIRSLISYTRIHLKAGETREIRLTAKIPPGISGQLEVSVGGGQPDTGVPTTSNVLKTLLPIP
ncbi:glycoside hydrolase family 3 C-terminal domain-containing protein [Dawidia soli]|uniref:Glycoside hydrolase family 3 C-terminal domain-containing protein n=1 Tax=Dawidia soli TaxID=2782352 RepID=A0AAP2DEB8_9BACT|nr:glycoside hydrolase family 3 C-terminal domain-containing protein [Dawidia soli]MBT1689170.1 glycoside hydrolase family 3 C-terminal domain-containing protein [Dawidia soli]